MVNQLFDQLPTGAPASQDPVDQQAWGLRQGMLEGSVRLSGLYGMSQIDAAIRPKLSVPTYVLFQSSEKSRQFFENHSGDSQLDLS